MLDPVAGPGGVDRANIAYLPSAFDEASRRILEELGLEIATPDEARALIDGIDVSTCIGLRDRALIGVMTYAFARVGAALGCRVEDVFVQLTADQPG